MQKIIPHLWFDKEAKAAADFYASAFPISEVTNVRTLRDTPSGDSDIVRFKVWGYEFAAISAGPLFKLNPSVSFIVNFDPLHFGGPTRSDEAKQALDRLWGRLSEGGSELMPLDKYPFSDWYGWIQDRYGVSWQLMLTNPAGEPRPPIIPALLFTQDNDGRAEEATDFYMVVFRNSSRGQLVRYPAGAAPGSDGTVMFTDFMLEQQWFAATDGGRGHDFTFNEAVSFMVNCDDQEEIDNYWEQLSAVPEAEQCGWLKDKFGVSWQIVPTQMAEMMENGTDEQIQRVTQAFLPMKKFDLRQLRRAYDGS